MKTKDRASRIWTDFFCLLTLREILIGLYCPAFARHQKSIVVFCFGGGMKMFISICFLVLLAGNAFAEEWIATGYCACSKCCGKYADGITASGRFAQEGMVAINWLPFGSIVEIDGKLYEVEDRGAKSIFGDKNNHVKRVDIYFDKHEDALRFGRRKVNLIIKGA